MTIKQRPPAYSISITFRLEDLDLIDKARMHCTENGKHPTYRDIFLIGCKDITGIPTE